MNIQQLQALVIDALEDVKGQDIKLFDTAHLTSMFERMVVASGTSNRQTRALATSVRDKVKEAGGNVVGLEGEDTGEWVLVDLGDMVVHIMQAPIRAYYRLEELWGERPITLEQAKKAAKAKPAKSAAKDDDEAPAKPAKRSTRRNDSAVEALEPEKKPRSRSKLATDADAPATPRSRSRKSADEATAPAPRSRTRTSATGEAPVPRARKVVVAEPAATRARKAALASSPAAPAKPRTRKTADGAPTAPRSRKPKTDADE